MTHSVFVQVKFWLLVVTSVVLPLGIYAAMRLKRAISPGTSLLLGLSLVLIAGLDVYFLQGLSASARLTPSLADDALFFSEISLALYLIPAMFGGIGVNVLSHVLVGHLVEAERRFAREHPEP